MGERGPVPNRAKQRRRRNKDVDGPPPKSGRGSGRDQWAEYAESVGVDVPVDAKRSDVMELVAEHGEDAQWHPLARQWYEALRQSGQAAFYQPSDWAFAAIVAEAMSRELSPQPMVVGRGDDSFIEMATLPPKGTSLKAWLEAMTSLLATEGARRRMRVELESEAETQEAAADVSWISDYRDRQRTS